MSDHLLPHLSPEYRGLLADVLDRPEDDAPRLVLADWLEDHGQGERAEFIRVQCELEPLYPVGAVKGEEGYQRWLYLRGRVDQLLSKFSGIREGDKTYSNRAAWSMALREVFPHHWWEQVEYHRGFVAEIRLTLDDFRRYAGALFAASPITGVTLTDRTPSRGRFHRENADWELQDQDFWLWELQALNAGSSSFLPHDIYMWLDRSVSPWHKQYLSRKDALDALSLACVAHGRSLRQAGLEAARG